MTLVTTRALEVLREFIADIEAVYPGDEALGLIDEWPDLHVTYQQAKRTLRLATEPDPRQNVVELPLPMWTEKDIGPEPPTTDPKAWVEWVAKAGVLRFAKPRDSVEMVVLGGMVNELLLRVGREAATDWLRRALSADLRGQVLKGWDAEGAWLIGILDQIENKKD